MNPLSTEPGKLTELPGQTVPYVLAAGGGRAHLLIDQVGRCLSGAEETGGAWSMMTLDGPTGRPIPLHFHRQEFEFFFCHRGNVQLWLGDESRLLSVGDFGFAPPNTVHAYALPGHHSGFMGPIIPGGWDRFFDLTGIPYSGDAPFPVGFRPEVPFAKFGQAEHDFDMKYLPEAEYASPRADAPDDVSARCGAAVFPAPRRGPAPPGRRDARDLADHLGGDRGRSEHVHRRAAARSRRPRARAREDHRGHLCAGGRRAADARRRRVLAAPGGLCVDPGRHDPQLAGRGVLHQARLDEHARRAGGSA